MSTTSTDAPRHYKGRHRRPLSQQNSGLIAAAGIWVVGTVAALLMTAVGR